MADDVRISNMPDAGSKEMVALKLWQHLNTSGSSVDDHLALFAKCLEATYRSGKYHKKAFE